MTLRLFPLDTSRLTAKDHAYAQLFADNLLSVAQVDPKGSALVIDLAHALDAVGAGMPVSTVRRLLSAVGFKIRRDGDENRVMGLALNAQAPTPADIRNYPSQKEISK